jgi:hypothetical protein
VNTIRGIGKIFEFSANANNVPEWINSYAPVYHNISAANGADNMAFEKEYSISAERAAREIVAEKPKETKKRKKRNRIS